MRVRKLREENIEAQRKALINKQKKERIQLLSKLETEENNLIIRMKREFDVLKKKIHLHENEIKRIQCLAAKYALKRALTEGELKRDKEKARKRNTILTASKSIAGGFFSPGKTQTDIMNSQAPGTTDRFKKTTSSLNTLTLNTTHLSSQTNIQQIRYLQKSQAIPSFYLKKSFGQERPVNLKPVNYAHEDKVSHKKVELYLKSDEEQKKAAVIPLTSLYDDDLNYKEKVINKNFINFCRAYMNRQIQ